MPVPDIRATILTVIAEHMSQTSGISGTSQSNGILEEVYRRLRTHGNSIQQPILTQWHELFRTGYLAWGLDIPNPDPPFFHVTEQGRRTLSRLSRDPGNPDGYLAHLATAGTLNPVAHSYLEEGLKCFVADLYKASAVMVGASAESVLLDLRDVLVTRLELLGRSVPNRLQDWKMKAVMDAMENIFDGIKSQFDNSLREEYEAYWPAFNQFIRSTRNDAGHPKSVEPISNDAAHAALLIFPEQVRLTIRLQSWVSAMT